LVAREQGDQDLKPMQALWLEDQKLEFRSNVPEPHPTGSEALIRVRMAGVCSTDLELVCGYYPFSGIPGHEFVGDVVNSPNDPTWVGKRVVGLTRHCERRRTLGIHDWDGAFAEYLVLPLTNLHEVPDQVPDKSAVFTEPLAAAYEILEQNTFTPEDRVLVIGAGRLGQLVAQVLQGTGCRLDVVARHSKQLELLTKRNIHTISIQSLGDKKYDVVIEATGSPDGFLLARKCIHPRGKIIIKSTYKGNIDVNLSAIVVDEVTLMGSRCGPFEPALKLLAEGKVDPEPLIDAVYSLEQGMMAFRQAAMPGVLKVLIFL
jgi:threonine dehydrogenase-like Zn-dependent dehydrogenase